MALSPIFFRRLLLAVAFSSLLTFNGYAQEEAKDPALKDYFVANGAYNRKLYPVAIKQYEAFLKAHPDHAKADLARRGLALSHYASKQYKEAIPVLKTLLAKQNLDPKVSRERLVMMHGQCLLLTGDKAGARTLYVAEAANLKSPNFLSAALATICDVSFAAGEWKEVLQWSPKLLGAKVTPDQSARALYQLGYAHYKLQTPEQAIAALSKISALKVDKAWATRASYLLGECYNSQKDYPKAEAAFLAALPGLGEKDATECQYRLGSTRFVLGKYAEAATHLTKYLTAAPAGAYAADARLYIARALLEEEEFAKAGVQLKKLAAGTGNHAAQASLWLARVHTRPAEDKDYTTAAAVLAKAVTSFPESPLISNLRFDYAIALMAKPEPDWTTALAALDQVAADESFGQRAQVLNQQAVCQQRLKDYASSIKTNQALMKEFPEHQFAADARFMLGENLFLQGKLEAAGKWYVDFLRKHPKHPNRSAAIFRQAQIHHAANRWEECLDALGPLLETPPTGRLYTQLPFMVGDSLFRMENWKGAIAPLEKFLSAFISKTASGTSVKTAPNVDTALVQLAIAYDRSDQKAKALTHLTTLTKSYSKPSPHLPLALSELGRITYQSGELKSARSALTQFLTLDTADNELFAKQAAGQRPRVNYYLGWVEASERKYEEAAKRFSQVVVTAPEHKLAPDAALQQGIALLNGGKPTEAASHFDLVLRSYPQHPKLARVIFHAGVAEAEQKAWDKAGAHFQKVVTTYGKSGFADQALYQWAWCERSAGRMEKATELYELLLSDYPESGLAIKVQSELAELNLDSGAQDEIIAQLTASLAKVKDDPSLQQELRYQLASAHYKKGDHANSAKQFESLLKIYPKSKNLASMYFQAGESRLQLKEYASARIHFTAAAKIPGSPQSLEESITMRLAETQAHTGQHAEAATSYAAFLTKFPESRWLRNARFGLASAKQNSGEAKEALTDYAELLAANVNDLWTVRARLEVGRCQATLKNYDTAVVEFVIVEISYPQYPEWQAEAVLEMGKVLKAQNKTKEATARFQDLIKRFPDQPAAAAAKKLIGSN